MGKRLSFGVRRFLREEKSRIRKAAPDSTEAERLVRELVAQYSIKSA